MKLIIKFLLLFRPLHMVRDTDEESGYVTDLYFKKLFGVVYVVRKECYLPLPIHFNCHCSAVDL